MAVDRDDLLRRIVSAAEYIEHNQERMPPKTKAEAMRRYDALCDDLKAHDEAEKQIKPTVPAEVQTQMDLIRDMLKSETKRRVQGNDTKEASKFRRANA